MIDFSNCELDKLSTYGGSDQKRGVIYNNKRYMLKLSDRIETDENTLNDSYSNSVYSEYICCNIIQMCGFKAQNTLLGTIVMDSKKHKDRLTPVVACENFIPNGYKLVEFKIIENALLLEKPGRVPKIEDIYEIINNDNVYFNDNNRQLALNNYFDTFIFDALFGNFDRHANNWGYLIKKDTKELSLAPIYDCGSCLYPQISDDGINDIINKEDEISKRIDLFPKAALLLNGVKISYKEYINSGVNEDVNNALLRVYPTIDLNKIMEFIDNIQEISSIRKEFYKTMIKERYDRILTPAYQNLISLGNNKETSQLDDTDGFNLD